ncbi:rhodanese-like domain-containing protein [Beijerinckia mobilis]|uniref:rhodanese-like domain-containing protein n=1 Tax=Beijerinckia mobilis TaxID=231434 RepID=UPI000556C4C9|nr:rhodanese-like domain-containing protein [Beijerinckia mobilis]
MSLKLGAADLVSRAMQRVKTLDVAEAIAAHAHSNALFVDLREPHEIERTGMIPGAVHVPRGTLEFRVDPESPFFMEDFGQDRPIILYCQLAARSALATATLIDMGIENVSHISGGFAAWTEACGPVECAG